MSASSSVEVFEQEEIGDDDEIISTPPSRQRKTFIVGESEEAKILFEGRNDVLTIINTGGEIGDFFYDRERGTTKCPIVNSKIKQGKVIGKGANGVVYLISFGKESIEYVMKDMRVPLFIFTYIRFTRSPEPMSVHQIWKSFFSEFPENTFVMMNGNNPSKMINPGDMYISMEYEYSYDKWMNVLEEDLVINKFTVDDARKRIPMEGFRFVFPAGTYACIDSAHSEYIISLLCADFYRNGLCINFLDVFGFSMCKKVNMVGLTGRSTSSMPKIQLRECAFFEKMKGNLHDLKPLIDQLANEYPDVAMKLVDSMFVQILFAIAFYQHHLGLQHNDLHLENIMYQSPSLERYQGLFFPEITHMHYRVNGLDIILPFEAHWGVVIKIVDFGLAAKFTTPFVCPYDIMDTSSTFYFTIPSWKDDAYDLLYMTFAFVRRYAQYSNIACRTMIHILDPKRDIPQDQPHETTLKTMESLLFGPNPKVRNRSQLAKRFYQMRKEKELYNRPNFVRCPARAINILQSPMIMGKYHFNMSTPHVDPMIPVFVPSDDEEIITFGAIDSSKRGTREDPIVISPSSKESRK
jgi:serine/threonine protein kinase